MSISILNKQVNNVNISFLQKEAIEPEFTAIFIHAFPLGKEMWYTQLSHLPPNIKGIAYDVRGFGESTAGHRFFNIDLFAKDLIAFIHELNLRHIVLCGISMGGYIALRSIELVPHLFSGLILADTNASADTNETRLARFTVIEKIQNGEKGTFIEEFLKKSLSPDTLSRQPEVITTLRKIIQSVSDKTICATQLALASRTDTSYILDKISMPVLIIRREEDQLMSRKQAAFLQSKIKDSELVEIINSGHLSNLENPEEFNAALNKYFGCKFGSQTTPVD